MGGPGATPLSRLDDRRAPCRWADMTGPAVGELARSGGPVALLPVGATEQHGPHLPTGTDTLIATAIADAVSLRTGAPVLPAVAVGCSYGHGRRLAGTLSLSPEELAGHVRRTVEWAADSGLRRVLAVNAHMGNGGALAVAGDHLRLERPDLRFGVVDWWRCTAEMEAATGTDGVDIHANRAETSVVMALAPELVAHDQLAGADDEDRTGGLVFRYTAESLSLNGVTGLPSLADGDLGRTLLAMAVDAVCALVERARVEEPPLVGHRPNPVASTGSRTPIPQEVAR